MDAFTKAFDWYDTTDGLSDDAFNARMEEIQDSVLLVRGHLTLLKGGCMGLPGDTPRPVLTLLERKDELDTL